MCGVLDFDIKYERAILIVSKTTDISVGVGNIVKTAFVLIFSLTVPFIRRFNTLISLSKKSAY